MVGLMNIQYAIANDTVYVLEANPRAVADRAAGLQGLQHPHGPPGHPGACWARSCRDLRLKRRPIPHFGVKEAVFPFNMFPEVDPVLGPEMRSTGEVLGMADSFGLAFYKAQEAAEQFLPLEGHGADHRGGARPARRPGGGAAVPGTGLQDHRHQRDAERFCEKTASRRSRFSRCTRAGPTSSTPSRTGRSSW